MKRILLPLLLVFFLNEIHPQRLIYKSDTFSVYSDRVEQGEFAARAVSRTEMASNYKSRYEKSTSRNVVMKFAINGEDNERKPGADHHFALKQGSTADTAFYKFGEPDPAEYSRPQQKAFLENDKELLIRLDMRHVLSDFKTKGFYETYDGRKITAGEFKEVYAAGGTQPLTWDWKGLKRREDLQLKDPDGDGIYELRLQIKKTFRPAADGDEKSEWKLKRDISGFPGYESENLLTDALYNMAIEEMLMDIRPDGAFMAGAQWGGVWTRDISYSILLSLAIVHPDAARVSLMAKVKNGKIIQDTGTGGAWPVSTDRMTWALAAWEIFQVTGDKEWLKTSFAIISKSAEADLAAAYDPETGLMRGESSFLDWREQTYPVWMDPKDIYKSLNLGTNAVHYKTYVILSEMAKLLGSEKAADYAKIATGLKNAINEKLWLKEKGYYAQYLYGRGYMSRSPKSEALGEALCVIFGIADEKKQRQIISSTPVMEYGIPCIYPAIPNTPPYHNDAIWPFVESFWAAASAKSGSVKQVEAAMASVYRAASLFLTNKENMVASSGDHMGTEINSDRQLWSLAGNLSLTYRIIFGMNFAPEYLELKPFIPQSYGVRHTLKNFKYRGSMLNIEIRGFGSRIKSVQLDKKEIKSARIPGDLKGVHELTIELSNEENNKGRINMVRHSISPETPVLKTADNKIIWGKAEGADEYLIFINGKETARTKTTEYIPTGNYISKEIQVMSKDKSGNQSFLSAPVIVNPDNLMVVEAESGTGSYDKQHQGYSGPGYLYMDKTRNSDINLAFDIAEEGFYKIDFRYANGNGPLITDNKCAVRRIFTDGKFTGAAVMPQRGEESWNDWGYTNSFRVKLSKGKHSIRVAYDELTDNMNGKVNSALLDNMRLMKAD